MADMIPRNGRGRTASNPHLARTSGKILVLLCRGSRTVNDLAQQLRVTDNAVRAQLKRLQRDELVRQVGWRRGVRRPHAQYELTIKARELFPRWYEPVLRGLTDVLTARLSKKRLEGLFFEAGRRLMEGHLATKRG